ncbi:MAG: N-acetylmuramoyl-L-alanine amidase [Deltaproteobacteria bacterium]|nr:N-acetylmuramoyl-L-alanine amidase [Deltaproteobacteria bacterium]
MVIELSERAPFEHHILEKPPDGKLPRRLYIDFTGAVTAKSVPKELPVGDGLLKQIRTGQFQENVARVVLDIESIDDFQIFPIFEPFRIVVDVTGEKRADALPPVPGATPRTWTVVLDPGHGGKDPGAMSRRGDRESRLVLAIAKEAKAVLERDGRVNVVMTRATDHFISLPQRTAIANQADADLFVSIHINSARNRNAYGIETYHFAPRAREEDRELVAAENATALESVLEMDEILAALNLSYKKVESNSLATLAQTHLLTRTRALHGDVPSRKVRSAPFYVLMGAKMPAVLVECGFITSNTELGRLKNNNYQRALGEGIADAVRAYIDEYNEG